jgi:hypothetical protein
MAQLISTTQKEGAVTTVQSQPVNSVFPIDQPSSGKIAYSSEWTWFTAVSAGLHLYNGIVANGGIIGGASLTLPVGGGVALSTGGSANAHARMTSQNCFNLGMGRARFRKDVCFNNLSTGTEEFEAACGLTGGFFDVVSDDNEALFRYTHTVNSGNWVCASQDAGGGEEITNTAVAPTTGSTRQVLELIVNDDATETQFYIDGVLVATHTAVPTVVLRHGMLINKLAGTVARQLRLLGAGWDYVFTTPV